MPFLPGGTMVDASGNRLVDASANPIAEAGIPVYNMAGGLLMSTNQGAGIGGIDWGQLASDIADIAGNLSDIITGSLEIQAMRNLQDDFNAFLANGGPDTFVGHDPTSNPSLISAEGIINSIGMPTGGGLTTEEHDALLALQNADLSGVPGAVWDENIDAGYMTGNTALIPARYVMQGLHWAAEMYAGYTGIPIPERPYFVYVMSSPLYAASDIGLWNESGFPDLLPILDLSLVQAGDTVLSYLEREYSSFDWSTAGPGDREAGGNVWLAAGLGLGWFRCTLTDADLRVQAVPDQISQIEVTVPTSGAPVWPGADGVTLGESVTLTSQLHLTGTMDGVIVAVTTPPTRTGMYEIGGAILDYGVGRIAFETDEGDIEPWQYLGFRSAIYTPKSMAHASGVRFQVLAGASGTVTPWVVGA